MQFLYTTALVIVFVRCVTSSAPTLNYKELFPPLDTTLVKHTDVVGLLEETVLASEEHKYFWILSHFPLASFATVKTLAGIEIGESTRAYNFMTTLLTPSSSFLKSPKKIMNSLEKIKEADDYTLFAAVEDKAYRYLLQKLLEGDENPVDQYPAVFRAWSNKYDTKIDTLEKMFRNHLDGLYYGEHLNVLLHELAYFLNLLPFETSLKHCECIGTERLHENTGKHSGGFFTG